MSVSDFVSVLSRPMKTPAHPAARASLGSSSSSPKLIVTCVIHCLSRRAAAIARNSARQRSLALRENPFRSSSTRMMSRSGIDASSETTSSTSRIRNSRPLNAVTEQNEQSIGQPREVWADA